MSGRLKSALLSTSAIALGVLITAAPHEAMAECLPDPAMDGDTVTCAANDFTGFTSGALDLTFIVNSNVFIEGTSVTLSGAGAVVTNSGFVEPSLDFIPGFSLMGDNMTLTNLAGGGITAGGVTGHGVLFDGNGLVLINNGLIATSGEAADGLLLKGFNVTVTNNDRIVASGALADAILLDTVATGTITNSAGGLIEASGDALQALRAVLSNNLTIINNGSIVGTRLDLAGGEIKGLVLGTVTNSTVTNSGTITISNLSLVSAAVAMSSRDGTGNVLTNAGTINVTAAGNALGMTASFSADSLINDGTITVIGNQAFGMRLFTSPGSSLLNAGTINADGIVAATGISIVETPDFTFTNSGDITVTGAGILIGVDISFGGGNPVTFINSGTVDATGGFFLKGFGSVIWITNSGTLIGDLQIDSLGSTLTQTAGSITGNLSFTTGSGTVALSGGSITGDIDFGVAGALVVSGGSLVGNITSGAGQSLLILSGGSITGNLDFGDTFNVLTISGGSFLGNMDLAADRDFLTFSGGTIVGNIDFKGDNDVLTLSGGGITGNILFGAGDDLLDITGGNITGDIDGGGGFDTLTLDIAGPFELGNLSNFETLTKTGAGTLTLSGVVNVGQATLSAGTTIVNGTLVADTTLGAGALLLGTGTVSGNLLSLGSLAPGGSIGTTTITGNYTQGPGGTLFIEIAADGSSDLLAITGTATLDGTLDITALGGPIALGTTYTIMTAAGGISGSFASVTQNLVTAPLALPVLTIGANSVTFSINVASFTIAPLNPNQTGVAIALDQFSNDGVGGIAGDYISDLAGSLLASIGGLLDPLVSEAAADFPSVIFAGRSAFLKTVGEASSHRIEEGRWSLWASAYGVFGNTDASLAASGYDHRYAGLVIGAVFKVGNKGRAGLTLGVSKSDLDVDAQPGKNRHEAVVVAFHAGWTFDALEITTVAAVSFEDYETSRIIASPSVLATARGDAKGTGFSGLIKASYRVERGAFTFLPAANFEIINFRRDAYEETGAGNLGLSVERGKLTSARLELGGTVSDGSKKRNVGLYAGAFWSHEFGDRERDLFATFLADPTASFLFSGVMADKDAFRATAGFGLEVGANSHLALAYDGLIGARQQTHSITARFVTNW